MWPLQFALSALWLVADARTVHKRSAPHLTIPPNAHGASIPHSNSFVSFSIEPAFWEYFWGKAATPNSFTFGVLNTLIEHGGQPHIRPGGETMDSMKFSRHADNVVLTTSSDGGVYRTTVGPGFYKSWSNFPNGTRFTSTLNFGNNSLAIAKNLAVASVKYQPDLVEYFELGNEPNNYGDAATRWNNSAVEYVKQWKTWTYTIDKAVNATLGHAAAGRLGGQRWWGSSATTDPTVLQVKPVDIIPDGVDSRDQIAQYSIHSYQFASCDPERAALATIPNVLNHTLLTYYADTEIMPSATAALNAGNQWIIGEFNSIACSGGTNVSNTFTQALWTVDSQLIYAARNASATYLHQGATLVFQSSDQSNHAGPNGTPSFSTYDMVYPRNSSARGPKRTLPGYLGVLFSVEALATPNTQVLPLAAPSGVDADYFSAYALYVDNRLKKLAILNMNPYYSNSTSDYTVSVNIGSEGFSNGQKKAWVKRLTSASVDEQDSQMVSYAGQSYTTGTPSGTLDIETVRKKGVVSLRGSEAVLVVFDKDEVYGLEDDAAER